MMIKMRQLILCWIALALAAQCLGASVSRDLADGVTLSQDISADPSAPLIVNAVKIDLKKPGVRVVSTLAQDTVIENDPTKGREIISAMVARTGALAGVNADFFPFTGDPLGLAIHNGELVSEPMDRAAVGITSDGKAIIDRLSFEATITMASGESFPLRGVNRKRGQHELVIFAPIFGGPSGAADGTEVVLFADAPLRANRDITCTVQADPQAAGIAIPKDSLVLSGHGTGASWISANLHVGDKLTLRLNVKAASGRSWDDVVEAVGGGPLLMRNGEAYVDGEDEKFSASLIAARHPRTAVGVTASGELLLVAVDGRQTISRGVTLAELAQLMKGLGAVDAINLDGGGSTSLSIRGIVADSPSEGRERPVANALLVYASQPASADGPAIAFGTTDPIVAASGEGRALNLTDVATGQPLSGVVKGNVVWGTTGGIGFVSQEGWFTPIKAGSGKLVALLGTQRVELPVTVIAGKPTTLTAEIVADPAGAPNAGSVEVHLSDANGNPVAGESVTISVEGGTPDTTSKPTDAAGNAVFAMTWDTTLADAKMKVSAAGLTVAAKHTP
jgi:exopolysaccharide biosynthesis protein